MELEEITNIFKGLFNNPENKQRRVRILTGVGGYDLFQECMEKDSGLKRIYMSKRPPRFMKSKARKSVTGRYYILTKDVSLAH